MNLPSTEIRRVSIAVKRSIPKVSVVYDSYWRFAYERQEIFFRRLAGQKAPWTTNEVMVNFKFTNVYRASDRVSQYLMTGVSLECVAQKYQRSKNLRAEAA